jgi:hypothetical protein
MNSRLSSMRANIWMALSLLLLALQPARALDIAGAHFDDKTELAGSELQLNGAGLRTKLFFKVYAIGLYLPQKADSTDAVLASRGPRCIQLITLRELTAEQLTEAFLDALSANNSELEMTKLAARIEHFRSTMLAIGKVPEKTEIRLDYLPASGTRLLVGNEQKGNDIAGEDFYQALLRIWLGNSPVQADIKAKLSGKS